MPRPTPARIERWTRAIELRDQGKDFATIGRELGVGTTRAFELYTQALRECAPSPRTYQHKQEQLRRCDDAARRLLELEAATHVSRPRTAVEALAALRGWEEHRARLLGTYAPAKKAISVIDEDVLDAEIRRQVAEFEANDWPLPPIKAITVSAGDPDDDDGGELVVGELLPGDDEPPPGADRGWTGP